MNYLAHLKLSGDHEYIMLGNFIADHIRGNKIERYPKEVVDGIMLHRKIDYYTDHHPEFMKTRARLHPKYHKYAGVIADVFYDHFLAKNWNEFSEFHLSSFTSYSYGILLRNYSILPSKTKKILPFFIMQNWLTSYAKMEGLRRSFQVLARRANYKSNMQYVVEDLIDDYELYEAEFKAFFPDIAAYCQKELDILFPADIMTKKNQIISEKAQEYYREQKSNKANKTKVHKVKKDLKEKEKEIEKSNSSYEMVKSTLKKRFVRSKDDAKFNKETVKLAPEEKVKTKRRILRSSK
jgi:acyl carrier protein phosphodiesterase